MWSRQKDSSEREPSGIPTRLSWALAFPVPKSFPDWPASLTLQPFLVCRVPSETSEALGFVREVQPCSACKAEQFEETRDGPDSPRISLLAYQVVFSGRIFCLLEVISCCQTLEALVRFNEVIHRKKINKILMVSCPEQGCSHTA